MNTFEAKIEFHLGSLARVSSSWVEKRLYDELERVIFEMAGRKASLKKVKVKLVKK